MMGFQECFRALARCHGGCCNHDRAQAMHAAVARHNLNQCPDLYSPANRSRSTIFRQCVLHQPQHQALNAATRSCPRTRLRHTHMHMSEDMPQSRPCHPCAVASSASCAALASTAATFCCSSSCCADTCARCTQQVSLRTSPFSCWGMPALLQQVDHVLHNSQPSPHPGSSQNLTLLLSCT